MRTYALVVLDREDKEAARHGLDIVTNPQENGFRLSLSKISGDVEDIITKVVQEKTAKKMNVIQHGNPYGKAAELSNWIQKYSGTGTRLCLEYNDTNITKYCEGKVTLLDKTEKDEYGVLTQALEFTPSTPYFIKQSNTITIMPSSVGKKYPYKYPYMYGKSIVENNEINNPYILDIPVIVTLSGTIQNPSVHLCDESGESYTEVRFLASLTEGEKIIINSAQRKIYKIHADGTEEDYTPQVDPSYDTFLRAKSGLSRITVNVGDAEKDFSLTGGWRQYTI